MAARTHGMSASRVFRIWGGMIQRCTNPKVAAFPHYGGRGIVVCDRWRTFANFLADMGEPPAGYSIERQDNSKGYEPDNCCWLPMGKQAQNRRGNSYIEVEGERMCLAEASRRLGIGDATLRYRLQKATQKKDINAPVGRDVFLTHEGETRNIKQWSEKLGINRTTIIMRRKRGWPVERVLGVCH